MTIYLSRLSWQSIEELGLKDLIRDVWWALQLPLSQQPFSFPVILFLVFLEKSLGLPSPCEGYGTRIAGMIKGIEGSRQTSDCYFLVDLFQDPSQHNHK